MKTIVQMAGVRNVDDALMCAAQGVDIIGLLVGQKHASIDFISKELAREIKQALPKSVKTTLITHLESADEIVKDVQFVDPDYIQLHSNIKEREVEKIRKAFPDKKLIRIIHILQNGTILTDVSKIKYVDFYFTDSINLKTDQVGGTGLEHDYNVDKDLIERVDKPVFVAGGLKPANVEKVVKLCRPYGVDVNSGCRGKDGFRDKRRVADFVKNAKRI